jgi:hypothetical protein
MAKPAKERIVTDVREQQEITSSSLPIADAVDQGYREIYRDPQTGLTALVGKLDQRRAIQQGRPVDYRFTQRMSMLRRRLRSTKNVPVTIINTLPIRLAVNSPLPALQQGVNACEMDKDFSFFTWMDSTIEVSLQEGQKIPLDYNPLMLAEEFMREYAQIGGVMIYEGTVEDFIEDERETTKKLFDDCMEAGLKWQLGKVKQANDYWNTPNHQLSINITELHRACATRCLVRGRIGNVKPAWMDMERAAADLIAPCKSCGAEPNKETARCRQCGYVIDPIKAFLAQDIDEKHIALERLTRAQVMDLHISDFVAETIDEREARLARGEAKPLSIFEMKQQAALIVAAQQQHPQAQAEA